MLRSFRNLVMIAATLLAGTSAARADDVVVFAAASMKTALDAVAAQFEAASGNRVVLSYGASSMLARQIENGAPADLFISANTGWTDELARSGRLAAGTRTDLLGNTLVLIARGTPAPLPLGPGAPALVDALGADGILAMALVDAVPAGLYGKAALQSLGVWAVVQPHLAQADNVRAALALVSTGAARFGIVYGSDAHADPSVGVAAVFPAASHPPIVYPVAAIAGHDRAAVRAFLAYLAGDAAGAVFEAQGFVPLEAGK